MWDFIEQMELGEAMGWAYELIKYAQEQALKLEDRKERAYAVYKIELLRIETYKTMLLIGMEGGNW